MLVVIITLTVSLVEVSKEIPEYKLEDAGGSPNSPYSLQGIKFQNTLPTILPILKQLIKDPLIGLITEN